MGTEKQDSRHILMAGRTKGHGPKRGFQPGDRVVCVRPSLNLGPVGEAGRGYTVISIAPKVRVTPGTGPYFLYCRDDDGKHASFNFADVRIERRDPAPRGIGSQ